jgi:hypothetical protein
LAYTYDSWTSRIEYGGEVEKTSNFLIISITYRKTPNWSWVYILVAKVVTNTKLMSMKLKNIRGRAGGTTLSLCKKAKRIQIFSFKLVPTILYASINQEW